VIAELNVVRRKLVDLKPHPKNPRHHAEEGSESWEALKRSLEHDYFDPLVLNDRNGLLVSGHYRLKVLASMGVEEVDVVLVDYDEPTHLARLMAANKQFGEWDEDAVSELARAVEAEGLDGAMAGFLSEDWDSLILEPEDLEDDQGEVEEKLSRAQELQEKWQVQEGEMFEAMVPGSAHSVRLVCGDCTDVSNWRRMLSGRMADMIWTDPPYNIAYDSLQAHRNEALDGNVPVEALQNDDLSDEEYDSLLVRTFSTVGEFVRPGGAIYISHADGYRIANQTAAERAGFMIKQTLIWVKSGFTLGRQDYQWQHEPILYGWKDGAAHRWYGGYSQATIMDEAELESLDRDELLTLARQLWNDQNGSVVREPRGDENTAIGHPTVKPLSLVARHVFNSSQVGDVVIEPFGGSGTTLVASYLMKRSCVATELDPKFCAVILERLSDAGLEVMRYEPESNA